MRILIDGDAFPDIADIIELASNYQIEVKIYVDSSHEMESDYAKIILVSKGFNAVDTVIENEVVENDLVLTQDYGVATIALSKKAKSIHPLGYLYTDSNINYLLELKHRNGKVRKHISIKGPKKRTKGDKERLLKEIEKVIRGGEDE